MKATPLSIPDVILLEPVVHADDRGYFFESFNSVTFSAATGVHADFVQDNESLSIRETLRGLHYQIQQPQGKLVRVMQGRIYDVAVDLRRSSPHFGQWVAVELSSRDRRQLWVPPGFAHGFLTLSTQATVLYKATSHYAPEHERCIIWDDPSLDIRWPLTRTPLLAEKDKRGKHLHLASVYP